MRPAVALLLLACGAAAYEGKYEDDARLARILKELPERRLAAMKRLKEVVGVDAPDFGVRLEDAGRDRSGAWAEVRSEEGKPVLILYTEYLVLGAHDLDKTLVHELFHCLHRARLGEKRYAKVPAWAREGAALFVADQGAERTRALAVHASGEMKPEAALARLCDGLEGRHTFLDYAEDVAAYEALGREKALRLVRKLLETDDVDHAVREVTGLDRAAFAAAAARRARETLGPLLSQELRAVAENPARALEVDVKEGVHAPAFAYYRALALHRVGRHAVALQTLRKKRDRIRRTTLLDQAVLLELRLLKALKDPSFLEAVARAKKDLTPFAAHAEVLKLAKGQ